MSWNSQGIGNGLAYVNAFTIMLCLPKELCSQFYNLRWCSGAQTVYFYLLCMYTFSVSNSS
jgi:hypothetical protein